MVTYSSGISIGSRIRHAGPARGLQHVQFALQDKRHMAQYQVGASGNGHGALSTAKLLHCKMYGGQR